jgi:hypothetical protein
MERDPLIGVNDSQRDKQVGVLLLGLELVLELVGVGMSIPPFARTGRGHTTASPTLTHSLAHPLSSLFFCP